MTYGMQWLSSLFVRYNRFGW